MPEAPKTVWVTKYALTKGLYEANVRGINGPYATVEHRGANYGDTLLSTEWHTTREAALARAEEMRAAKIASLKRQIAKLEALTF